MASASSSECCRALMEWVSRFGLCQAAISDNGNSFVSNLYKDIMATFNIKVHFTPNYHPASNGAIERRHQTIKNALKASLIDMGNHHGDKWADALPWVLMGKRCAFQPDLGTSASILAFGRSPLLPGQLLGHPGPPLTNDQTKELLEQLYQMENKPGLKTSSTVEPIDVSYTDKATHVYVKVHEPRGLYPRFEGPWPIVSRPSRSQVQVKIGSYANKEPRLAVYSWASCKIAHLRGDAEEAERPQLGRKPKSASKQSSKSSPEESVQTSEPSSALSKQPSESSSTKPANPHGPVITQQMFDKADWPAILQLPSRPKRSTRNQNPNYIEAVAG